MQNVAQCASDKAPAWRIAARCLNTPPPVGPAGIAITKSGLLGVGSNAAILAARSSAVLRTTPSKFGSITRRMFTHSAVLGSFFK
jgi:hypothetical protein